MDVVAAEEHFQHQHGLIKGKRTKRQRPLSELPPLALTMSSCSSGVASDDQYTNTSNNVTTPTTSWGSTEEEEDMANCLILLAQGYDSSVREEVKLSSGGIRRRESSEKVLTADGFYVYECKTCNKCFSSFQALGGHRASHKKPKLAEEKKAMMLLFDQSHQEKTISSASLHLQMVTPHQNISSNNNKSKIHECSICGAEFSSGQALGGHMRRHRATTTTATTNTTTSNVEYSRIMPDIQPAPKKLRAVLSLDLNLPAPEDERSFATKPQPMLFSGAPALVDCHY